MFLIFVTIVLQLGLGIMAYTKKDIIDSSMEQIWNSPTMAATLQVKNIQTAVGFIFVLKLKNIKN